MGSSDFLLLTGAGDFLKRGSVNTGDSPCFSIRWYDKKRFLLLTDAIGGNVFLLWGSEGAGFRSGLQTVFRNTG